MEAVGLDIGNGFGYASIQEDEKKDPSPMIPSKYNLRHGMPTDVYVTPPTGEPIVVYTRKQNAGRLIKNDAEHGIHAVKTYFGTQETQIEKGSISVSVDKAYAAVVRDLMLMVNEQRKAQSRKPLYDVVFTFPVDFAEKQEILNRMQKAIEGVELDGQPLKVVGRLPEPVAVAIDYLYYVQNIATGPARCEKKNLTVLVYDLGHGTFDAALVKVGEKVGTAQAPYLVLDKDGDPEVGGKNFDKLLYNKICSFLKKEHDYKPLSPNAEEEIMATAINTKLALTDDEVFEAQCMLPSSDYATLDITREEFENWSAPLLNKTVEIVMKMMERAETNQHKIDAIVLSGGGARMPMVEKVLTQLVEEKIPVHRYRPSEAVSYGAARFAGGIALEETTEYAYGVGVAAKNSLEGEVMVQIQAGMKLPAASKPFRMKSSTGQFDLELYRSQKKRESRSSFPRNEEHGKSLIRLKYDLPANTEVEFVMTVEKDYNVTVSCKLPDGTVWKRGTANWLGERSKA